MERLTLNSSAKVPILVAVSGVSFASSSARRLSASAGNKRFPATSSQNRSTSLSSYSPLRPVCPNRRWTASCNKVKDHAGLASWSFMTMNGDVVGDRKSTKYCRIDCSNVVPEVPFEHHKEPEPSAPLRKRSKAAEASRSARYFPASKRICARNDSMTRSCPSSIL